MGTKLDTAFPSREGLSDASGKDQAPAGRLKASIAVLVPCYNEELTVAKVVRDFKDALPAAKVYVYDNNSTDRTVQFALAAGAIVRRETLQGKGSVVRRMFADVEADVYILVDGDDTYDAKDAPRFVAELLNEDLDMVNGRRVARAQGAYRPGHVIGNVLISGIVRKIFGDRIKDMLSGYKVMSRRFVKSFPGLSSGFEIETELTVHALELGMPVVELPTMYGERSEESPSKLRTFRDGIRIVWTITRLVRAERPLEFFAGLGALLAAASVGMAVPLFLTYLETGLVPRFPTAVLSASTMLLAFNSVFAGLILDTVTRGRQEMKRMQYLAVSASRTPHEC
jgi:hypothetical protein